jgi:hypothetical protein
MRKLSTKFNAPFLYAISILEYVCFIIIMNEWQSGAMHRKTNIVMLVRKNFSVGWIRDQAQHQLRYRLWLRRGLNLTVAVARVRLFTLFLPFHSLPKTHHWGICLKCKNLHLWEVQVARFYFHAFFIHIIKTNIYIYRGSCEICFQRASVFIAREARRIVPYVINKIKSEEHKNGFLIVVYNQKSNIFLDQSNT